MKQKKKRPSTLKFNRLALACILCALCSCASPTRVKTSAPVAPAANELNLPWQSTEGASPQQWQTQQAHYLALLADDANQPDAHQKLAELYFKQYLVDKMLILNSGPCTTHKSPSRQARRFKLISRLLSSHVHPGAHGR